MPETGPSPLRQILVWFLRLLIVAGVLAFALGVDLLIGATSSVDVGQIVGYVFGLGGLGVGAGAMLIGAVGLYFAKGPRQPKPAQVKTEEDI